MRFYYAALLEFEADEHLIWSVYSINLQACEERIKDDTTGEAHCTGQVGCPAFLIGELLCYAQITLIIYTNLNHGSFPYGCSISIIGIV